MTITQPHVGPARPSWGLPRHLRSIWRFRSGRVGAVLVVLVLGIALLGPFVTPHSPEALVGAPYQAPSTAFPLGTDFLGRDALSRFLDGGRILLAESFAATLLAYLIGVPIGMLAGVRRGAVDMTTVGVVDVVISFPPIVLILVLVSSLGPGVAIVVLGITVVHAPRIVRIVRSVTTEVFALEYVEAAIVRGERLHSIIRRDILPNISTPILADFGLRLTYSIILVASLGYLGLGQAPPAADWGLMIGEDREALLLQPWVVVAPAAAIALLAIGVNLIADSVARSLGRSLEVSRD